MSYFNSITQNVVADNLNSYSGSLASNATFIGTGSSTLGVAGIQVSLKADQNCYVYVDQSPDNSNWDITDTYNYYASIGNFGTTVQAINSYYRVRVTNTGPITTTSFRLQTALCPVVEAVPRSLDRYGNFKTSIYGLYDNFGFSGKNTPIGELRVVQPYRLVGAAFSGNTLDTNFWTSSLGTNGTGSISNGIFVLGTGTTANNSTFVQSARTARYTGGSSNRYRAVIRLTDTGSADNVRKWGAFDGSDGAYYMLSGSLFCICTLKGGVQSTVSSSQFNGTLGSTFTMDNTVHTYEIYWTNSYVYFIIGNDILHTWSAASTAWATTLSLPIRYENTNYNGKSDNISLTARTSVISRLGQGSTQPTSKYISGTTTGNVCKYGAGNLHSLVVGAVPTSGATVTLYDGTSSLGNIIGSFVFAFPGGGNFVPSSIDMRGLPFFSGLTAAITTQSANITLIYE